MTSTASRLATGLAIVLSLNLGACFGGGGDYGAGEALELGLGVATLGLAVAGAATGGGANTTQNYNVPVVQGSPGRSGTYVAPRGNGYSQNDAFDDCARLYGSVGATQQMAECRHRSSNMSSLR